MTQQKPRSPVTGTLVGVRLQPDALKRLDDWRREQEDIPNRSEAIRRLLARTLDVPKRKR